ncbi:MAG: hypothetical protein HOP37_09895, partial [Cyclobacteriaceae bacterium]|nr:hypothetical protein [Cyclobacteriaceae bacterium]
MSENITIFYPDKRNWKYKSFITSNVDTIEMETGTITLNEKLKPLKKISIDNVSGDSLIEAWQYSVGVDSLKRWGPGDLYIKSKTSHWVEETFEADPGTDRYQTDVVYVAFKSSKESPPAEYRMEYVVSLPTEGRSGRSENNLYIAQTDKNPNGTYHRITRTGTIIEDDDGLPSRFELVSKYTDEGWYPNGKVYSVSFFDHKYFLKRRGWLRMSEQQDQRWGLITNPTDYEFPTAKHLGGMLDGVWQFFVTSPQSGDSLVSQVAYYKNVEVGTTEEDRKNAIARESEIEQRRFERSVGSGSGSGTALGEKCTWCKIGRYVNGTCNSCGTVSAERERELKGSVNNSSRKIDECPYRSSHAKIQFP